MIGWTADLFRLAWGLLYWNARKTAFRMRRGRGRCPCQNPSDSGRALETACEACIPWNRPARFRRVCPLLVRTPKGWQCSADTADVRPFWGRAVASYGTTLAAIYLASVVVAFSFLRIVGYPISIVHVAWPGLWYRVPQARGSWFLARSDRAIKEGRINEGLLYLSNAFEFDSSNFDIGIRLAQTYEAGNPFLSDRVYDRLVRQHPKERDATAALWLKALVARGNLVQTRDLAASEVILDATHANGWMRALVFACRATGDAAPLKALSANPSPAAVPWRTLLATELLLSQRRTVEALAALKQVWPAGEPAYAVFYQVRELAVLGDPLDAADELGRHSADIDGPSRAALTLEVLARAGAARSLRSEAERLLAGAPNIVAVEILCAELIRNPNPEIFGLLYARIMDSRLAVDAGSAEAWFSLLCAAGVSGDEPRFHALAARLKSEPGAPVAVIGAIEGFFGGVSGQRQASSFLPYLKLPLDIDYAMLERYPKRQQHAVPTS